jgi:uncharacterized protein YecT (DUF1311 family)
LIRRGGLLTRKAVQTAALISTGRFPICAYGEMEFKSDSGVNFLIQYSNSAAGNRLSKAIEILQRPTSRIAAKPITSAQKARKWPSMTLGVLFACFATVVSLVGLSSKSQVPSAGPPSRTADQSRAIAVPAVPPPTATSPSPSLANPASSTARNQRDRSEEAFRPVPEARQALSTTECLSIADVDMRVGCLEQAHADRAPTISSGVQSIAGPMGTSFNCAAATNSIEKAICADRSLAQLDRELGLIYRKSINIFDHNPSVIADQRQWILMRNRNCNKSVLGEIKSCLTAMTKARIAGLTAVISAAQESRE